MTCAKMFASSVSLGCGAPGGSFGPTFFIGTMAGGLFQRVSAMLIPHLTGPRGSYALVGLGAFLAGTTHAPLTALFLLWEMTHSDTIALPSMIATITALVVARAIETESIDEFRLARQGKTLQIGSERLALTLDTGQRGRHQERDHRDREYFAVGSTAHRRRDFAVHSAGGEQRRRSRGNDRRARFVVGAERRAGARPARQRLRHLQCAMFRRCRSTPISTRRAS